MDFPTFIRKVAQFLPDTSEFDDDAEIVPLEYEKALLKAVRAMPKGERRNGGDKK